LKREQTLIEGRTNGFSKLKRERLNTVGELTDFAATKQKANRFMTCAFLPQRGQVKFDTGQYLYPAVLACLKRKKPKASNR